MEYIMKGARRAEGRPRTNFEYYFPRVLMHPKTYPAIIQSEREITDLRGYAWNGITTQVYN